MKKEFDILDYCDLGDNYLLAVSRLEKVLPLWGQSDVEGKSILDIGCGTKNSIDSKGKYNAFGPFLARLCNLKGAKKVEGIDIAPQEEIDRSVYTHHQVDIIPLLEEQRLASLFSGDKFDWINCSWLFCEDPPGRTMKSLASYHDLDYGAKRIEWINSLLLQAYDLLNEDGFVSIDDLFLHRNQIKEYLRKA